MHPWSIDAREAIKNVSELDDDLIEKTDGIRVFLHLDRYYFVIATKGLGKSLLLLAKRKNLRGIDCIIPQDILLDVPVITVDALDRGTLDLLYQEQTMPLLWSVSIITAIIKHLGMTDEILTENISDSLQYLLKEKCMSVSSHFGEILTSIRRKQFFRDLTNDHNRILIPATQRVNRSVAVFIDNVDECFEKSDRSIWYNAQNGLIVAIYKLVRLNPKLKLFASIRKEAFLKLRQSTEMFQQYGGVSLDLSYYKEELKEIFVKNIQKEDAKKLVKKDLQRENSIPSFLGIDKVRHGHVNEDEDTFDYIYRHTLKRPRDFMEIGGAISNCPVPERNPTEKCGIDKIKLLVNETGTTIATAYVKEILPHLTITEEDLKRVFGLIDSNILEKQKLKNICMRFNGNDAACISKDCKMCTDKKHIFCELYKIGLLGYVAKELTKKSEYIQKFAMVGEKIFDEVRLLPDSTHYLIHPILDFPISQQNPMYMTQINTTNIVGYDRPWKLAKEVPSESTHPRPTVFISSTKDLENYRNKIEKMVCEQGFTPLRSEYINRPNTLQTFEDLASGCDIFTAILGPRYGEEFEGKSICEHEFDSAYKDKPGKIIVYVLEGDIQEWDEKQQKFVQKVQSLQHLGYSRGDRINPENVQERFRKDLIEKIATLLRDK